MSLKQTFCVIASLLLLFPMIALAIDSDGDGVDDTIDVCCETPPNITVDSEGRPLGDLDGDCDVDQDDFGIMQRNFTGPKPPGEGPCPIECRTSDDCLASQFCAKPDGECDTIGVCEPRPTTCPDFWDPVCGCDGRTYGNECEANAAGVSVDYAGECRTYCTSSNDCNPDEYCAKAEGDCDGAGECFPRPDICPEIWHPVCGCDGQTYANECYAAMEGVSVDYAGECRPACAVNADCEENDYCAKADGDCGGEGACDARPINCPYLWDPVCACDGVTYANGCVAAMNGVNVDYPGECRAGNCWMNSDCPNDQDYCSKLPGDCGGVGECSPKPQNCALIVDPVCGCDGRTYGNECEAAAAGVNVYHGGVCLP
jgi:hypothetical protein